MIEGGHAANALPQRGKATINSRLLPNDDAAAVERTLAYLAGEKVTLKRLNCPEPSPPSPMRPDVMGAIEKIAGQLWPAVPVVPAMSTGASDSRFLRNAGLPTKVCRACSTRRATPARTDSTSASWCAGCTRAGSSSTDSCGTWLSELGYRSPSSEIVHTAQGDRHRTWRFRFNGEGLLVWSTRSSEWAARGSLQPSLSLPVKKGPAGRSSAQQPARSWATPGAMSWGSSGSTASCALGPDRRVSTELPTLSRAIGFRSLAAGDPMR